MIKTPTANESFDGNLLDKFLFTGVCESYRLQHDQCGPLEQANGHCGCGPGLLCQFVPEEITTAQALVVSKKRKIYVPGPGSFQCEVKQ